MSSWFDITKLDNKTYAIAEPGHWERCISYLLIGDTAAALIDTGLGIDNIKSVTDQLTPLPVKVLTTHTHWDHIGGHGLYDEIYIHSAEQDWLINGLPLPIDSIRASPMREPLTRPVPLQFNPESYVPFQGQPTGLLADEAAIDLGGRRIIALHTPGHSPGHLCFYEADTGYLFTGDLLYQGTLYAFYPSTDPKAYSQSVAKLASLDNVCKLLPGHNELAIPVNLLSEAELAFKSLAEQGLLHQGSGTHDFGSIKIKL